MQVISNQSREEKQINENLNLLSIFYFIFGGLTLLGAFIMIVYSLFFGFVSSKIGYYEPIEETHGMVGTIFSGLTIFFIIMSTYLLTIGILLIISGFKLRARTHRMLSLVMGILVLPSFPFGTALGVFALIVLSRIEVKELYKKTQEALDEEKYGIGKY